MLFFVVHVISFERSPDCFVVYIYIATGFSLREPDRARERARAKERAKIEKRVV